MCWVLIACVSIIVICSVLGAVLTEHNISFDDDILVYTAGIALFAPLFIFIVSFTVINTTAKEKSYPIKYENHQIVKVDESKYYLKITNRRNYWTWKNNVTEYRLYENINCRFTTKNKTEIIKFFEPEVEGEVLISED